MLGARSQHHAFLNHMDIFHSELVTSTNFCFCLLDFHNFAFLNADNIDGLLQKKVTPLLTHWSYVFLAFTHWYMLRGQLCTNPLARLAVLLAPGQWNMWSPVTGYGSNLINKWELVLPFKSYYIYTCFACQFFYAACNLSLTSLKIYAYILSNL